MKRIVTFALLCASVVLPARAQAPAADWRDEVRALLERRAAAVRAGDRAAFARTMAGGTKTYREARMRWFTRMRQLPITDYSLELDEDGYHDLAPALAKEPRADEVHVVGVTERYSLRGYDEMPTSEPQFLTVGRTDDRWSIIDDDDLEDIGIMSARDLWDFAAVRRLERGGVMVLYHGSRETASRMLTSTREAMRYVAGRWPLGWRKRAVVMIPKTAGVLSRMFRTPIDLGPFVAFMSSSLESERGSYELTGHRIAVQPATFFATSASFARDTLSHEVLHLATRSIAGPWIPSWLDEGVAQVYGERSSERTDMLARAIRSRALTGLPQEHMFFTGGRTRILAAYQASASFMRFLRARFGSTAGARLYRELGKESTVSFGTARYHADRAMRRAFKRSLAALEAAWMQILRRRFA